MSSQTTRRPFRAALVAFTLLLASTLAASADTLIPNRSTGGSGGGGGVASIEGEAPTLVGSDADREFVYVEEVPTLVGSGIEREFVYVPDTPIAGNSGDESLTAASASHEDLVAAQHDALAAAELKAATHPNARSIQRAEDVLAPGGAYAGGNELAETASQDVDPTQELPYVAA